jgi:cell division septum initiation protein DivIVA
MPSVIEKSQKFNRTVVHATADTAGKVAGAVCGGVRQAFTVARDAGATVVGQTRSATARTVSEASTGASEVVGQVRSAASQTIERASSGAKEVVGQARAQGERAGAEIDEVLDRTADRAIDAVDPAPSSGTPYEQWTKSELYERAQELDVEGRSNMSKRELIAALRAA